MLDDYEHPDSSVNGQDIFASWILTAVFLFGLFVFFMI
jgi:hypothetical protein